MNKINIPKFYYHKKTLYIDKETYNRDVMKVKEYKEEQLNKQKEVLDKIKEYCIEETVDNREYRDVAYKDALNNILELLEEIE
jgi:hypothetical protein